VSNRCDSHCRWHSDFQQGSRAFLGVPREERKLAGGTTGDQLFEAMGALEER